MQPHQLNEMMRLMGQEKKGSYGENQSSQKWKLGKNSRRNNGKPPRRDYSHQPRTLRR